MKTGLKTGDILSYYKNFLMYLFTKGTWTHGLNIGYLFDSPRGEAGFYKVYDDKFSLSITSVQSEKVEPITDEDKAELFKQMWPSKGRKIKTYLITEYFNYLDEL